MACLPLVRFSLDNQFLDIETGPSVAKSPMKYM